ncbi:peptidylprolyl isomerase [Sphingomonas flavalba]|uniref:peptidylprolyl isomerase n=1 Tax=Sphingomonas flavalba TaxID=2559804 RepID=UPI00109DDC06|nr:peptidylprolyl isomerase [Sphingomonas flavalba]
MTRRFAALALILALAAPAFAQDAAPAPTPTPPPAETVAVVLETSAGAITLALEKERAPVTTANFLRYVDQKKLDGTTFYRAVNVVADFGLIQGGTIGEAKRTLPPIAHEPTSTTGLTHTDGTISMARAEPGTAAGDFFITVGDMPSMDADPSQPGDNAGYAAFGHVIAGMDVVRGILAAPTSPTEGEGSMIGQMLSPRITILSARRVVPAPPPSAR